jgi:hypothetical protein
MGSIMRDTSVKLLGAVCENCIVKAARSESIFVTFLLFRSLFSRGAKGMGVTVQIGAEERAFDDASESWINDQIGRRQRDGGSICVMVKIQITGASLQLTTPGCGGGSGGGRQPNPREQQIIELWNERRLSSSDFTGGNVVAFVKQLRRLI